MAVTQTFWDDADVFNSIEKVGWRCSKGAVVPNGKVSMGKASNALKRANGFPKTRSHRRSRYGWVAELRFVKGYVLMRNNFQPGCLFLCDRRLFYRFGQTNLGGFTPSMRVSPNSLINANFCAPASVSASISELAWLTTMTWLSSAARTINRANAGIRST